VLAVGYRKVRQTPESFSSLLVHRRIEDKGAVRVCFQ